MSDFKTRLEEEIKETNNYIESVAERALKLAEFLEKIETENKVPTYLSLEDFSNLSHQLGLMRGVISSSTDYYDLLCLRLCNIEQKEINEQ